MKECPHCLICVVDHLKACPHAGTPLDTPFPGDRIIDGKYSIEQSLGHGGMGVVYRVRHISLQRQFALKLISVPHLGSKSFLDHFQMEARALGRLKHPNIVDVTDYGVDPRGNGLPYLVMEYLHGQTLSELCHREGGLPLARALPIFEAVARGIDYAHGQGVLHRDLKPSNVLIIRDQNGAETTKILDFGLARLVPAAEDGRPSNFGELPGVRGAGIDPAHRSEGAFANTTVVLDEGVTLTLPPNAAAQGEPPREFIEGTVAYLAPEALRGAAPAKSADIYALGVLIYETLVGKLPFSGTSFELLWSHLKTPPPTPSQVQPALSAELDPVILSALAKEPAQRPARAKDLVMALRNGWLMAQRRAWRAREIPRRLAIAALLGIICALASWTLVRFPLVENLELRATDARFAASPLRDPDSRLLILTVDEASLAADPTPLAERADEFGTMLERISSAGARGVAIDFVLPEQWSRSQEFSRFLLKHAENVTLAVIASPSGEMLGTKCIHPLTAVALGPTRFSGLFGLANLSEDADGRTRRAQLAFRDTDGKLQDSWAAHASRALLSVAAGNRRLPEPEQPFRVDYSVDWRRFRKISWKDAPAQLSRDASVFQGRVVLVGGDLIGSGDDYHRIPARSGQPEAVSGLTLQSLLVNTILSGFPVQDARPGLVLPFVAAGCAAILAAVLCIARLNVAVVVTLLYAAVYGGAAVLCFRLWELVIPLAGPLLMAVLALGAGLMIRFYLTPFPVVRSQEA